MFDQRTPSQYRLRKGSRVIACDNSEHANRLLVEMRKESRLWRIAKAKFESEASANRAAVEHVDAREFTARAESCDRMAASIGAILRAPDTPAPLPATQGYCAKLAHESQLWFRAEYVRLAESHAETDSQFERDECKRKVELLLAVAAFRFEGADIRA